MNLSDGCAVGSKVPEPNISEQRCVLDRVDHALTGRCKGAFGGVAIKAKRSGGRLDMPLDVGPFDRDLIRSHVDGANDSRQSQLQDKTGHHKDDRLFEPRHPNQRQRCQSRNNEEPAQRESDLFVHVIGASHEGVRVEQKLIVAQINPGCKTKQ